VVWARSVRDELRHYGLDPSRIKDVIGCPFDHDVAAVFNLKAIASSLSFFELRQLAISRGIRLEQLEPLVVEYGEWKGKVAAELGCTLLVDDRPDWVLPGCAKYGVSFLDIGDVTPISLPLRIRR